MPVSLSIKAVPDELVERLRRRAEGNHRSLQRELMAIVEAAVQSLPPATKGAYPISTHPTTAFTIDEPEPVWRVAPSPAADGLLDELDAIVAGSQWGSAPLLTRDQLHDRPLARELDFDARQTERAAAPRCSRGSVS